MKTPAEVVIVGGGLAGLAAAAALSGHPEHVHVRLLEAKRKPGGRAGSFRTNRDSDDEPIDYCQHVAMGCCTAFLNLLKEAELTSCFTRYEELTFYHPETGFSSFRPGKRLPAPLHLAGALAGLRHLSLVEKRQIQRAIWTLMRTTADELQGTTAEKWLTDNNQTEETMARFWDVILVSALGARCQEVSMAAARKVIIDGFAMAKDASDVWVPNRPLADLFGERLPHWLQTRGVEIHESKRVSAIDLSGKSVRVSCGSEPTFEAEQLILAANWRGAERLLKGLKYDGPMSATCPQGSVQQMVNDLGAIKSSPITGLHLWFDRALTELPHVVMVGTAAQWLFRQPLGVEPSTDRFYHQVVISGQHDYSHLDGDALVEHVCNELRQAFPDAKSAKLLRSRLVTDPNSVYQVSPEFEKRRLSPRTPFANLQLAGDWVQTGWPATMEGAVRSGMQAAAQVADQLGFDLDSTWRIRDLSPGLLARCLIRATSTSTQ